MTNIWSRLVRSGRRLLDRFRQGVDDFVGAGVVEAFAGFVFDGAGVGLEPVYVLAEAGVFLGELVDFLGQGLVFGAFLLPTVEAVAAVDYVPGEEQREDDRGYRAEAAVGEVLGPQALKERGGLGRGLGLVAALAADWGVEATTGGKLVWALLRP